MFKSFGAWELILILGIVLLIFGAARLPQIGGAMGKAIKEFRSSLRGEDAGEQKAKLSRSRRKTKKPTASVTHEAEK